MNQARYATLSILMAAIYQVMLIVLIFLRPDIHPYSSTISEWSIGKFGWLMQCAFFCSALSYLFLFLSLKNVIQGIWGKIGMTFLFISFIGTAGAGAFVTDPYPPDFTNTQTLIHTISGAAGMILIPFAALLIHFNLAKKNYEWVKVQNTLKLTGFLPLIAFVGFIIHLNLFVMPLGENAAGENVPIGYPPRLLFLTYHIWLSVLALQLIKLHKLKMFHHDNRH